MKSLYTFVMILAMGTALCTVLEVNLDGTGDYTTIKSAVDASADGDTVLVHPGIYVENVDILGRNQLTLCSLEAVTGDSIWISATVIDGNQTSSCVQIMNGEQDFLLQGLTLTNGSGIQGYHGTHGGGVIFYQSTGMVVNCDIYGNSADSAGGVAVYLSTVTLAGTRIHHNSAKEVGGGIDCSFGNLPPTLIFDPENLCSIYENRSADGHDLRWQCFYDDSPVELVVYLDFFTAPDHESYYSISEDDPDYLASVAFLPQRYWRENIDSDLWVAPWGDDQNAGTDAAHPWRSINKACRYLEPDGEEIRTVHLLPGVYQEEEDDWMLPITPKGNTRVIGAGMEQTIIEPQFSKRVVAIGTKTAIDRISDFTIQNSTTGRISAIDCGDLFFSNICIRNMSTHELSKLFTYLGGHITYQSITIANNIDSYGRNIGYIGSCDSVTIVNCDFAYNVSWMDELDGASNSLRIINTENGSTMIRNSRFLGNQSLDYEYGGSDLSIGPLDGSIVVLVENSLFANGLTQVGLANIGISTSNGQGTIRNCTFYGNTNLNNRILHLFGNIEFYNNIFWANDAATPIYMAHDWYDQQYTTLTTHHNCLQDYGNIFVSSDPQNQLIDLGNNIFSDPLLAFSDSLDFQLSADSPCIDAGYNAPDLPPTDLAGNLRVWGDGVDIGCYEFGAPSAGGNEQQIVPPETEPVYNYPNPFNPETTIVFQLYMPSTVKIVIYNIRGQIVRNLLDERRPAGEHRIVWDGRDDNGAGLASGIYFYHVKTQGRQYTRKCLMLK